MKSKLEPKIVYVDFTDWQYEIMHAAGGNKIYATVADLKEHRTCWKQCGIAKCELSFIEMVEPPEEFDS